MSLIPGSRFGAYDILAPLGAGGMGEVYRARDGKLNRDVAIKILPIFALRSSPEMAALLKDPRGRRTIEQVDEMRKRK